MLCPNPSSLSASAARLDLRGFYRGLIVKAATIRHLDQILAHSILSSHHPDLVTATLLLRRLSDLRPATASASHLLRLFSSVPDCDIFFCNVLIRSLPPADALGFLSSLPHCQPLLRPNSFTYAAAISASSGSSSAAVTLHARIIIDGFANDPFVGSALADLYLNLRRVSLAEKVFDGIPRPDTVLWNTLISGLVKNCSFGRAVDSFRRMVAVGEAGFDSTTLAVVLPATAELQDLNLGTIVHSLGLKLGMASLAHVITGLISMYSKCGEISSAKFLFEEIENPDLVAYNSMISGYSINGNVGSSVGLFKKLLVLGGEKPNSSTLVGLIPVFGPFGHESLIQSIHSFAIKTAYYSNAPVATAITTVYCRLNDMEIARKVFDAMPEKSMASWNAMISGYAQNGLTEMAISLFREMQELNIQPNPITVTSILSASAQLGALSLGKWVHEIIVNEDIEQNVYVSTALIDMYAKCGNVPEARRIFDHMKEKNVVSWNAMISAYGLHGHGYQALDLFKAMLYAGIIPTSVTFLSALYACSHAGLVNDGRRVYWSMMHEHGVKPGPEHYACMVDLLGRAGQLKEALKFIETIPENAGPGVWGALLGACMKYKESDLAQLASERLFELEPENPGYYVLLSNIHAAKRNYSEAAIVREEVRSRKLVKTPGCTLIEIGYVVHTFTAGDWSHPQSVAIYSELENLTRKIVEAGYQPETIAALYDVEDEEKEHMVKVHSEKLAITFGIMSTEAGTEIKIIKNLRVCLDCHTATKFISKVTRRRIVVRDATRFHHFENGICSCGDYW